MERAGRQSGHAALQEECRDAAVALRAIQRREDEEVVGDVGQADPDLLAVEDVAAFDAAGACLQVAGIGPHPGLRQRERRQLLAARLRHQPALALLLGAPLQEGQRIQPDVDALDDAERGVGPLELLAQQGEADVVGPGPAVRLGDRRPQKSERAELGEDLGMDLAGGVPVLDVRDDLGLCERMRRLLDQAVLVAEAEVDHAGSSQGRTSPTPGGPLQPLAGESSRCILRATLPILGR